MKPESLVKGIQPKWQKEFLRFVETGDAEDRFLEYLDHDEEGKQAVELAFNAQADALKGLADALRNPQAESAVAQTAESAKVASARMTEAVEGVLQLPPEQENQAVEHAASVLGASLGHEGQVRVRSMVQNLGNALAKVATHE
jgi:hypothetical protein